MTSLLANFFLFELKLQVSVMIKAESNREICFVKAVFVRTRALFFIFCDAWCILPPPLPILLGHYKKKASFFTTAPPNSHGTYIRW